MNYLRKTHSDIKEQSGALTGFLTLLCWIGPFFGFGIFFPIGVLLLYKNNLKVRSAAFQSLIVQCIIYLITYPLEIGRFVSPSISSNVNYFLFTFFIYIKIFCYFLLAPLILILEYIYINKKSKNIHPFYKLGSFHRKKLSRISYILLIILLATIFAEFKFEQNPTALFIEQFTKDPQFKVPLKLTDFVYLLLSNQLNDLQALKEVFKDMISILYVYGMLENVSMPGLFRDFLLDFWMFFFMLFSYFKGKGVAYIFRRPFASLYIHDKFSGPGQDLQTNTFYHYHKLKFARIRECILPGWGHIYINRYWFGFPVLFLFLLSLLFFATSFFYYLEPAIGVDFLGSMGLKLGIKEKGFLRYASNVYFLIMHGLILLCIYFFSFNHLNHTLKQDQDTEEQRGLVDGFNNNIGISILVHIILLAIVFIIPININRNTSQEKKKNVTNYQPEKLEYYFIDPEIPDEVKDLNGGVISGTETPTKDEGEKVIDETPKDEGKVKGFVKRIRGKKLPKTYSNYISARMRGPEGFMEYWKRAPFPYSSVVAYTITTEGDIIDVEIVEASGFPEQDALTVELIQSMSPVMPPPDVKGDVRVTELFWNGPINPDSMPTPLQKDLVTQFDGRVMEEF